MSAGLASLAGRMSISQFFEWEAHRAQEAWELVRGEPVAMSPERNRHVAVKGAAYRALFEAVRAAGLDCTVLVDGTTVLIDDETARRPDVSVQCGSLPDGDSTTLDRPTILVEVVSPSSIRTDTSFKFVEYFSLPSVKHYIVIDPDRAVIVHHRRDATGEIHSLIAVEGLLDLAPPGFKVSVRALLGEVDR